MKHPQEMKINLAKFHELCEAYEVLSNRKYSLTQKCVARLKIVYDQHGEDTLLLGVKDARGNYQGGYIYQQNCYQIFDKFFLQCNPFHATFDGTGQTLHGSMFGSAYGGAHAPSAEPAEELQVKVPVTLQEFYHGCVKLVVYRKRRLALDGHTLRDEEDCVRQIVVKAGMSAGQVLRFKGEGHEQYKREATDLVITLVDRPAAAEESANSATPSVRDTRRKGNDLIYTSRVTLQEALKAEPAIVHTLDGRLIKVPVDHVITPKTVIKIDGEGMPIINVPGADPLDAPKRGDLYLRFDIRFPKKLTEAQRQRIEAILVPK
jgi:DnaJ-class molecular chaperone